nr:hypothetical protein BaRGS_007268 [Batillaria attramentaria]
METSESWKKSVPEFFPELHRRAYFSPPTLFNRVAFETGEVAGAKVKVPVPSVQLSDVRENEAQFRVHYTFQQVFRDKAEPMVVVSNVIFDNYLNNPDGIPAISKDDRTAKSPQTSKKGTQIRSGDKSGTETHPKGHVLALFKRPRDLSSELQRGTFDMLFISKKHGLIICDIKALGDAFGMEKTPMSEEKKHAIVKDKVTKALKQLEKEKRVLKYLTSDVKKGLRIRAVLILPNMEQKMLERVLSREKELKQVNVVTSQTDNRVYLTGPPGTVRELQKGAAYSTRATYRYATGDASVLASLPPPTDGPPVKRIRHTSTHEGKDSWNCGDCGREVATFLTQDLLIGKPDVMTKNTNQRRLKFSDVIVSGHIGFPTTTTLPESLAEEHMEVDSDDTVNPSAKTPTQDNRSTGFLQGLRNKDEVPLEIITKQDTSYAEKLSCPTEDKVQVAEAECILGTERPVVVVIGPRDMNATCPGYVDHWCDVTGTCVSQLVVVEMNDCFAKIQLG